MQMLRPIYDRIIVKPLAKEEKTKGGLFIPGQAQETQACGTVLITGEGKKDAKGIVQPMTIKIGDVVYYGPHVGLECSHAGHDDCLVMNEDDIIGLVDLG